MKAQQLNLVPPHGGELKPLLITDRDHRDRILKSVPSLPTIKLTSKSESDLIMLATGAFSPLTGFMKSQDYVNVLHNMRLSNGLLWPIPINLPVSSEHAGEIEPGDDVALIAAESDELMAVMTISEKFPYGKDLEAKQVFGTLDMSHPGVEKIYNQPDTYLAGDVKVLSEGSYPQDFKAFARPAETRQIFADKGWRTIAAFQTRNPIHRSHEYLTKVALELCDGLLIHPVVGKLKVGDIPADVRMKCYQAMMDHYYNPENTVLKVYPIEMLYGGPREAILHAIIRQNFGCSHMIIGRDHAGVGDFYGAFEAQEIFETLQPGDLHLKPIKMDWTFWCRKCETVVSAKTCPHKHSDHLMISGTKLREMLSSGERPPVEISRPEVVDILSEYYQNL